MKNLRFIILTLLLGCNYNTEDPSAQNSPESSETTTYYFIRHAEKDLSDPTNKDPELAQEGFDRAEKWAGVFKEVPFDLIYSTNYKRTRSTARRIADSQDKDIKIYDANKLYDKDFAEATRGKTILVVGHSNTNPGFANAILGEERYRDIAETESGSLFIISLLSGGSKHSQVLYVN